MAGWNEQTVSVAEEIKFMYDMSKKGFMQTVDFIVCKESLLKFQSCIY